MKIGLPKALLYYRYGALWKTFFGELGCEAVISGDTYGGTLSTGARYSMDESCLPLKLFMGHVHALIGRCDAILVPRFARQGRNDEYCVRFWGLPDTVQNTFPDAPLLSYNVDAGRPDAYAFIQLGRAVGKGAARSLSAYRAGVLAQRLHDRRKIEQQARLLVVPGLPILIAGQPYLSHEPYWGGVVARMIERQGGTPLFSDRCDRAGCRALSGRVSSDLYWGLNKEIVGAIEMYRERVAGVVLLTAFPCGSDSLVNELVMRRIRDVPLIQILMDEQTAPAGLETRIESFMDILTQRNVHAGYA